MMETNSFYSNFIDAYLLRKHQSNLRVYFDAADTISCVQGIYDFYDKSSKQIHKTDFLKKEGVLVQSLATIGLLGQVYMLLPHQEEFLNSMERNYVEYGHVFRKKLKEFLGDIIPKEHDLSHDVQKLRDSNQTALKILTSLFPNHWESRFYDFIKVKKYIVLEVDQNDTEDDSTITDQFLDLAAEAFSYFEERRPDKTINNKADALALELFARKVYKANRHFRFGDRKPESNELIIPVLFDKDGRFTKLLREKPNLRRFFTLTIHSGADDKSDICLLRESKFFFCISLYEANKIEISATNSLSAYTSILPKHSDKLYELENYFRINETSIGKLADGQEFDLNKINKQLEQYFNLEFIVNVIIPCFIDTDRRKILDHLARNYVLPNHVLFEPDISKTIQYETFISEIFNNVREKTDLALSKYSNKYGFLFVMLHRLPKLYDVLSKFENVRKSTSDLFHIVSLTRFFFPSTYEQQLSDKLLSFGRIEQLKEQNYISEIAKNFQKQQQNPSCNYELYEILSILWLSGSYHFGFSIFHLDCEYPSSILMIFGALFVRDDESFEKGFNSRETRIRRTNLIIDRLRNTINFASTDSFNAVHCHMAISYLKFQLVSLYNTRLFTKVIKEMTHEEALEVECLVADVLSEIGMAYTTLNESDVEDTYAWLYLTNLKIYFTVELGSDADMDSISDMVNWFINQDKFYPTYWHYRYDDTIARYFYRRSLEIVPDSDDIIKRQIKLDLASNAWGRVKRAYENANKNINFRDVYEINGFKEQVDNYFASLLSIKN
ncbi:hypothetical protein [Dyadobacter luticola]|uniref:Uncharacterized protein n=1 Tax=Dyadobacter luticola TaxID=1979387 RepID=A0A5R9KYZ5_9BACT|nr:hypothetical protein [Dyadobacter luticola]TLV01329.1 hypothetical protein FEN17_18000 [Dyadobacter luticola]